MELSLCNDFVYCYKKVTTAISLSGEIIVLQSATRRSIFHLSNQCLVTNYSTGKIPRWPGKANL